MNTTRYRQVIYSLVAVAMLATAGSRGAHAQGAQFAPIQCSTCPAMTTIPFSYSSQEFADDPNSTVADRYINNLNYTSFVWGNYFVKKMDFHFSSFDLENNYDYFGMKTAVNTNISGIGPGWYGKDAVESFQSTPMTHTFTTDSTVTRAGFVVDQARVCCTGYNTNAEPSVNASLHNNMGVLLGKNDTVYFKLPTVGSGKRVRVTLNGAPGTDFDLYAACRVFPTPTSFVARAFSGDSSEFLELSPSSCSSGNWYIAVNSYNGAGRFDLRWGAGHDNRRLAIKVGIRTTQTPQQLADIATAWQRAVRQLYGQTEGQVFVHTVDIYNGIGSCTNCNGTTCDVCYRDEPGTGYCCNTTHHWIAIDKGYYTNYEGLAHEMLHKYLSVWDEYYHWDGVTASLKQYDQKPQCGHSNLASFGSNNNLCTSHDHKKDPFPGAPVTSEPAVWPRIRDTGKVVNWYSMTPDNYDYLDHDFNGAITVRTQ